MRTRSARKLLMFIMGWTAISFSLLTHASSGITYHGRLLKPDGLPVTSPNVQFKMQIKTPGIEDCVLYEEVQTQDLSTTNGMFALSLGDGSGVRQDSNSWNLFDSLSNRKSYSFNGADCTGVNSYNPGVADNRKFRVFFNDGSFPVGEWEALPTQFINYIPMAIESYAVGGFPASALLRVENSGTLGSTTPLSTTQYNEILALTAGTSSLYTRAGQLNGSTLPTFNAGESVRWNGSAWQAFTPLSSETDPTVSAFAKTSLPTCTSEERLTSDGTSLSCESVADAGWSEVDATPTVKGIVNVPVAGGLSVSGGALSLTDVVTSGTYTKVSVDEKGRVTSGSQITGDDIQSGTIGGSTSVSTTGTISASGGVSTRQFDLYDSDNTNHIAFRTPATGSLTSNYTLVFPNVLGTSNQILGMNAGGSALENKSITAGSGVTITHSAGGIQVSATGSGGTVTSVSGTSPILVDNNDPNSPIISIDETLLQLDASQIDNLPAPLWSESSGHVYRESGFVGVGTDTPSSSLHVIGTSPTGTNSTPQQLQLSSNETAGAINTGAGILFSGHDGTNPGGFASIQGMKENSTVGNTSGYLRFATRGSAGGVNERVRITSTGNMGIGTTNPARKLTIHNGGNFSEFALQNNATGATTADGLQLGIDNTGNAWLRNYEAGTLGLITNGVTRLTVFNDGNIGIGTTASAQKLHLEGASGSTLRIVDGNQSTGRFLTSDANGVASWADLPPGNSGTVTSVSGTAPITVGGTAADPIISLSNVGTAGTYGSATQVPSFTTDASGRIIGVTNTTITGTSPLGSALNSAQVWIGDGANQAQAQSISGDLSIENNGTATVSRIQNTAVNPSAPTASGQVLKFDGTTGYDPSFINVADLRSSITPLNPLFPLNCTSAQTLTHSAVMDQFLCTNISEFDPKMQTLTAAEVDQLENIDTTTISAAQWGYLGGLTEVPLSSSDGFIQGGNSFATTAVLGTNDAQSLQFETNNMPSMTILNGGNVGIGTIAPVAPLEVASPNGGQQVVLRDLGSLESEGTFSSYIRSKDSAGANVWYLGDGSSGARDVRLATYTDYPIHFMTNGLTRMSLTAIGNVGIGTTNPIEKLEVKGEIKIANSGENGLKIVNSAPYVTFEETDVAQKFFLGVDGNHMFLRQGAIGNSDLMTIKNTGRVGVGTVAPLDRFHVNGGSVVVSKTDYPAYYVVNSSKAEGAYGRTWGWMNYGSGFYLNSYASTSLSVAPGGPINAMFIQDNNGYLGIGTTSVSERLTVSGNVRADNFLTPSDSRLKENVTTSRGLSSVLKMRGVNYNLKSNGVKESGVIAQELEQVIPWAVMTDENTGLKAVKYQNLISPLIESTKELYEMCEISQNQLDETIRRVASLENENKDLKEIIQNLQQRLEVLESDKFSEHNKR